MISVIIPTFNEEKSIVKLLEFIHFCIEGEQVEVIVCDGGSFDKTVELAHKAGARVIIATKKGRAVQMNDGARIAKGEILYFLHADSYPPKSFVKDINLAISNNIDAGCYRLAFDDKHPLLKCYAWFTKFDIDYFRFGDQSLFIKKVLFIEIGQFDESQIVMEDQMLVRKIKKRARFQILNGEVITSARKYRQVGIIKLQFIFTLILILFYLGVSQEKLLKIYVRWVK